MKVIVTIGPSSNNIDTIKKLKNLNVDCFRINLSHCNSDEILDYFNLFEKANIIPCFRYSRSSSKTFMQKNNFFFEKNENVTIYFDEKDYEMNSFEKRSFMFGKNTFRKNKIRERYKM